MNDLVDRLREFAAESDNSMPNLTNEAAEEIVRLSGQLNLLKRIVSRLPLCPDHRDKVRDRCVECDNERLRKENETLKKEGGKDSEEIPIVCCSCGVEAVSEEAAIRFGWEGFSQPTQVWLSEQTWRLERLGTCGVCKNACM